MEESEKQFAPAVYIERYVYTSRRTLSIWAHVRKCGGDYPDDISFIKKSDPVCNFYKKKSDVIMR